MTGSTITSDKKAYGTNVEGDTALEAAVIYSTSKIQRMVRHILNDNCDHCRAVLNNNEAGLPSPAPNSQPDSTPIPAQIPTEQRTGVQQHNTRTRSEVLQ